MMTSDPATCQRNVYVYMFESFRWKNQLCPKLLVAKWYWYLEIERLIEVSGYFPRNPRKEKSLASLPVDG